ncbi:MAG: sulfotransferase domain-containing protein [Spiribacter salinus]|uniref:Sulfotransferase domain-containing protein n=1 Tax=Spiribacter salinus TaxID=1335746 RepID=A0A540VCI2_9GAMM|nr:MAG: sulfotransferase domain-containing protein [Spiribacter salinus]
MTAPVVFHIGLHKTGTRFLQRMVFARLDSRRFAFNPPQLANSLRDAFREPSSDAAVEQARAAVEQWRNSGDTRTLVLSIAHASGDMYGMHQGCETNARLVRELLPEARIVYVVRHPASWLQSAYRQSLVKDPGQPIERFLNFYDGRFRRRPAAWVAGNRNVDAHGMRFLEIYRTFARAFGPERVWLFTQEDMRRRSDAVGRSLAELLGLSRLPDPPARALAESLVLGACHSFILSGHLVAAWAATGPQGWTGARHAATPAAPPAQAAQQPHQAWLRPAALRGLGPVATPRHARAARGLLRRRICRAAADCCPGAGSRAAGGLTGATGHPGYKRLSGMSHAALPRKTYRRSTQPPRLIHSR